MLRTTIVLTLCVLLGALVVAPSAAEAARPTRVELALEGMDRSTPGRVTVQFVGHISAIGPGPVQYRFLRSDGAVAPVETANFGPGPGSVKVRTTWTLGANYEGWQQLKIVHPPPLLESRRVPFRVMIPPPVRVTRAFLSVERPTYAAPRGPVSVVFRGQIAATGACDVRYRFVRSDGVASGLLTLPFAAPGVQRVSTAWAVTESMSGWVMIEVRTPNELNSNRAAFRVQIGPRTPM